ncbi:GLPGLI family protein [Sinomicrobium sp. M5D2P9]
MKKHHVILFGSILFFMGSLDAQNKNISIDTLNLKCTYVMTFQVDSTDTGSKEEEFMILEIGKNRTSKFLSYKSLYADSMKVIIRRDREEGKINIQQSVQKVVNLPRSKFDSRVFKNYPKQQITYFDKIARHTYTYEEPLKSMQWNISEEKMEIAGYACQKATTTYEGRDYIAWFTTEIPISEGPYKFIGLPGLIVKIEDTKQQYSFELTKLEKIKDNKTITFPEKNHRIIKITKNEYKKTLKRLMHNTVEFYEQEGFSPMDDEHEKRVKDRFKRRNNTIEVLK